jgi:hypothetical protein
MAITGATLSALDEALKEFYLPGTQEYLNNENILSSVIGTNEEDVSGKEAVIYCHYGRSGGGGSRADGGDLPTATYQKGKKCTIPMKYQYHVVEVTGPTIAATRDPKGSYVNALDDEIMGAVDDAKKETNRMLWGCGYGVLARWRSTESATSYTLQKKYRGNSAGGDAFGSAFGGKYLDKVTKASPVVITAGSDFVTDASDIAVSALTKGTTATGYDTITCTDPSVTEAAGTFYVRPGNLAAAQAASGAARYEIMGLRGIVTDTDLDDIAITDGSTAGTTTNDPLQGLDVSTYPWFKALVDVHGSGRYAGQRALSLELMQQMFDMVEETAGKDVGPNLMLTTRAIRREYLKLVQADRRTVNTMTLDGGWEALDYNGVPFVVDNDAIDGEIYFITTSSFALYRMSDWEWMQKDGSVLSRVSGKDAYGATLFRYAELGCRNRAANGVLCDLSYTKGNTEGYGG